MDGNKKDPNISNAETGQEGNPGALPSEMSRNEKVESVSSKAVTNKFPLGKANESKKELPPIKDEEGSDDEDEEFESEEDEIKERDEPVNAAPPEKKEPQKGGDPKEKESEAMVTAPVSDAERTFLGTTKRD